MGGRRTKSAVTQIVISKFSFDPIHEEPSKNLQQTLEPAVILAHEIEAHMTSEFADASEKFWQEMSGPQTNMIFKNK